MGGGAFLPPELVLSPHSRAFRFSSSLLVSLLLNVLGSKYWLLELFRKRIRKTERWIPPVGSHL